MRHLKHRHKLGVKTPHRAALLANLSASLFLHKRIRTTLAKAKALRPFAEQVVTLAKKARLAEDPARKLHYRRLAVSKVRDQEAVALLFNERVEEFLERSGGYTRIYKLVPRKGDAAGMAIIELIDADDEGYPKSRKGGRRRSRRPAKKAAGPAAEAVEETAGAESAGPEGQETAEESEARAAESTGEPENAGPSETIEGSEEPPPGKQ
ncbi:MAG: 50S ribosomal protein L17 [Puniceicoccaceae bacterium]